MRNILHFVRPINRQKSITFLAVFSLSLGIAVSLLITLGVWEECSFDRSHKNRNQIYRLLFT